MRFYIFEKTLGMPQGRQGIGGTESQMVPRLEVISTLGSNDGGLDEDGQKSKWRNGSFTPQSVLRMLARDLPRLRPHSASISHKGSPFSAGCSQHLGQGCFPPSASSLPPNSRRTPRSQDTAHFQCPRYCSFFQGPLCWALNLLFLLPVALFFQISVCLDSCLCVCPFCLGWVSFSQCPLNCNLPLHGSYPFPVLFFSIALFIL